jgi:tetraacyldisaccharide 4'-kinase
MPRNLERYHRDLISGARRGPGAALMRGALGAGEPLYAAVTSLRNRLFAAGVIASHRVDRPVISVGNITTGGTGKTPVVRWLADRFIHSGVRPAVLLRGYRGGDEARLLASQVSEAIVEADPDRVAAARRVIEAHPQVGVFVLDDGFQHRRIQRDFDLVLIDASNPFGFGHLLPRGLLREPLAGLARASAFLVTHTEIGEDPTIESTLRRHNALAPIYRCRHVHCGLRDAHGRSISLADARGRKALAFCGIGNPAAFDRQIESAGITLVASRWFADHHDYAHVDLEHLKEESGRSGAELLLTTEKDWVKLSPVIGSAVNELPPLYRVELRIEFAESDEPRLFEQIESATRSADRRAPRGEDRSPAGSRS